MAWSNGRFTEISKGWEDVAEDSQAQYYGTRCIVWARLRDSVSGKVVFAASHHGPLPVDTGGATGGASVARRINEVVYYNSASDDIVIIGGDFNAHNYATTVTTLRDTYGFNLRASDWVDHIFTKNGVYATPTVQILQGTGSDHDGVKLVWSNGLDAFEDENDGEIDDTGEEGDGVKMGMLIASIVGVVLLFIGCVVVGVWYCRSKSISKTVLDMDEEEEKKKEDKAWDMSPINVTDGDAQTETIDAPKNEEEEALAVNE